MAAFLRKQKNVAVVVLSMAAAVILYEIGKQVFLPNARSDLSGGSLPVGPPPVYAYHKQQIPKIIHQSWKTNDVPESMLKWSETCKSRHKDYMYILWTDEMNRDLIKNHYSWFLDVYDALPRPIMRADAARLFYMHHYGGIYLDLDFECLRPMDKLLPLGGVLLGSLYNDKTSTNQHNIPNAWMASVPGHRFWLLGAWIIANNYYDPKFDHNSAESMTGPFVLHKSYLHWLAKHGNGNEVEPNDVTVLGPDLTYPFNWQTEGNTPHCRPGNNFDIDRCKKDLEVERKGSYVITYWSHSWGR